MGCVLHLSVKLSFHRLSSGSSCAFLIFPLWKVKANKDSVPYNIISKRSLSSWPKLKLEWDSAASNIISISCSIYYSNIYSLSCGLAVKLYKWGLLSHIMVTIPPLLKKQLLCILTFQWTSKSVPPQFPVFMACQRRQEEDR